MSDTNYMRLPKRSGDATSIQGTPVSATEPADGQTLVYDSATDQYVPQFVSGSGDGGGGGSSAVGSANTVQTTDGSGALQAATNVKAGENYLSVGSTAASTGSLRVGIANGDNQIFNMGYSGGDVALIAANPASAITFSNTTWTTQYHGNSIRLKAGTGNAVYLEANGTTAQTATSTALTAHVPLTASAGARATYLASGDSPASTGFLRLPYNGGSATTIFAAKGSAATDLSLLTYGPGDAWTLGNTSQDLTLQAYGFVANSQVGDMSLRVGNAGKMTIGASANVSSVAFTGSAGIHSEGTLTAVTSVSASHYLLNGSGNAKPTTGMLRLPYNNAATDQVIVALDNVGSNTPFLQYGPGHTWTVGQSTHNLNLYGYSMTVVSQNAAMALYGNGGTWLYDYSASRYSGIINGNGWQLGNTSTGDFGGGVGVLGVDNATTNPSTNPTAGGILYADAGAGKWRGSSGTVTTFGTADPHCPTCGRDFATEHKNDDLGEHLAVCLPCLVDAVAALGVDTSKFAFVNKRAASKAQWDAKHAEAKARMAEAKRQREQAPRPSPDDAPKRP